MSRAKIDRLIRRVAFWTLVLLPVVLLSAFIAVSLQIGADVRSIADLAQQSHRRGDRVEALIQFVGDNNQPFRDRNRAVWALGQLGDPRALPVLKKYYTGAPCNHAASLCQRELKRAIKLANGGLNVTTVVWR
jgi:hypothetical protein